MKSSKSLLKSLGIKKEKLFNLFCEYGKRRDRLEPRSTILLDMWGKMSQAECAFLIGVAFEHLGEEIQNMEGKNENIHRH